MSLGHFQLYPEETFIAHLCFMESIKLVSGASPKLPEEKQDNHWHTAKVQSYKINVGRITQMFWSLKKFMRNIWVHFEHGVRQAEMPSRNT